MGILPIHIVIKAVGLIWSYFYQKIMDEKRGAEDIYVMFDSRTSRQFLNLDWEKYNE